MKVLSVKKTDRRYPSRADRGFRRAATEYNAAPRLYISHKGETVLDDLATRRSRPTTVYRSVLPEILEKLDLPSGTKVSWSQKAGCPCGCSPGFVLRGTSGCWDAWATVCGPAIDEGNPKAIALADARRVQVEPAHDFGFPREILN